MNNKGRRYITEHKDIVVKDKIDLRESIQKVLKEAEEELDELEDDVLDEIPAEEGNEENAEDILGSDELTPSQQQEVEDWSDELLSTNIVDVSNDNDILDADSTLEGLDDLQLVSGGDDLPIDAEDLQSIIDADNSLELLQNELESSALEISQDDDIDNVIGETEDELLDEAIELLENIALKQGPVNTSAGVRKTVKDEMALAKKQSGADIKDTDDKNLEILKTTDKHFAKLSQDAKKILADKEAKIQKLVLENYALLKTNNLLVVAGNLLTEESRVSIVENFAKCTSTKQVDKAFDDLKRKLKEANEANENKKSLMEGVNKIKKNITVLKESKESKEEKIDYDLERKKHLMGLKTQVDVYNK